MRVTQKLEFPGAQLSLSEYERTPKAMALLGVNVPKMPRESLLAQGDFALSNDGLA